MYILVLTSQYVHVVLFKVNQLQVHTCKSGEIVLHHSVSWNQSLNAVTNVTWCLHLPIWDCSSWDYMYAARQYYNHHGNHHMTHLLLHVLQIVLSAYVTLRKVVLHPQGLVAYLHWETVLQIWGRMGRAGDKKERKEDEGWNKEESWRKKREREERQERVKKALRWVAQTNVQCDCLVPSMWHPHVKETVGKGREGEVREESRNPATNISFSMGGQSHHRL